MKAIVLREVGGPDNLVLETVPDPTPGPGEVVVRLHAAALNHRDVWIRKGMYPGMKFPAILGSDGTGEIVAAGTGATRPWLGRNVIINPGFDWGESPHAQGSKFRILGMPDDGTYAQLVKVPSEYVHRVPANWSPAECAALPLAGLTAYRAVATRAKVQRGEIVLVTGIGGGVAQMALQIAQALGAKVFVTSGHDDKLARAQQLGAAGGANYRTGDWIKSMLALTGGIDAVIDSAGGANMNGLLDVLKPGGRIATFGATSGPTPNFEITKLFWKQISLLGTTMGTPAEFEAMLELYESTGIRPVVDKVFPLRDAAEAHRRMESAGQFGKIVLEIKGE